MWRWPAWWTEAFWPWGGWRRLAGEILLFGLCPACLLLMRSILFATLTHLRYAFISQPGQPAPHPHHQPPCFAILGIFLSPAWIAYTIYICFLLRHIVCIDCRYARVDDKDNEDGTGRGTHIWHDLLFTTQKCCVVNNKYRVNFVCQTLINIDKQFFFYYYEYFALSTSCAAVAVAASLCEYRTPTARRDY